MASGDLTAARARELYRYDPDTGILWRRHARGEKTGRAKSNGYLVVCVDGRNYQTHRVIWLMTYRKWPTGNIDHINRVKTDNRLSNLRDVSQALNMRNSDRCVTKAQVIGPVRSGDGWMVVLPHYLTTRTIGPFASPDEAHAAFLRESVHAMKSEGRPEPKLRPPRVRV